MRTKVFLKHITTCPLGEVTTSVINNGLRHDMHQLGRLIGNVFTVQFQHTSCDGFRLIRIVKTEYILFWTHSSSLLAEVLFLKNAFKSIYIFSKEQISYAKLDKKARTFNKARYETYFTAIDSNLLRPNLSSLSKRHLYLHLYWFINHYRADSIIIRPKCVTIQR